MAVSESRKLKIEVRGIVQGVGFRPFIYNLAVRHGLKGSVANTGGGVEIYITGPASKTEKFLELMETGCPPLARILETVAVDAPDHHFGCRFEIVTSDAGRSNSTLVSPDIATCSDCVSDILSSDNRRYDYPFTNCTNCGPRLTIIEKIPYDRKNTSMAAFTMCPACLEEYNNPQDRRFHAQPNACPACGPELSWHDGSGLMLTADNDACIKGCVRALKNGGISAIKGLGGFHLAVDALSEYAVRRLRKRKSRRHKPLAVMAADLETAETVSLLNDRERELLCSKERPIVLVRRKQGLLPGILAPGIGEIGIMLPYAPLHHLLFARKECPRIIVMTSGNQPGEPICMQNREALEKLGSIADFFLMHNRAVVTRVDDSVARVVRGRLQMIRRSRGYVPVPLEVRGLSGSFFACGAELKNTFCISRGEEVFPGQHIGDLKTPACMAFFEESAHYMRNLLEIVPESAVCDMHPDYLSSRYAAASGLPCTKVQHHHAHAAAVMAEHGLRKGIAAILDGAGLGTDGTVWGGEFFYLNQGKCRRTAHLMPLGMPGGDSAVRDIWRMGLSLLAAGGIDITDDMAVPETLRNIPCENRRVILQMLQKRINTPLASSSGRLFDAVASLLGIRQDVTFEAQAAMELESLAWDAHEPECIKDSRHLSASVAEHGRKLVIDHRPLLHRLLEDMRSKVPVPLMALRFHSWLACSAHAVVDRLAERFRTRNIILGGGCFQNRLLLEMLSDRLGKDGYRVYTGEQIPVNDGGVALGQLFAAGFQNRQE